MPERLLVLANRTCPCPVLLDKVAAAAGEDTEVCVVSPALNSRLRHLVSDTDGATAEAQARMTLALDGLKERGIDARGEIGDADPLIAAQDIHGSGFEADRIIVATWPEGDSHWQAKNLPSRLSERFDAPVDHVITGYGRDAAA